MHDKSYFKEESGREAQEGGDICVCVCVCVCIYSWFMSLYSRN